MEDLIDSLLSKKYDKKYIEVDCLTDIFIAVHDIRAVEGYSMLDEFLVLFSRKCKCFHRIHALLEATYSIKEKLPRSTLMHLTSAMR